MPIPYMGSKRKSAGKIYQTIKNFNTQSNKLVDLFCGGLAITENFIKNGWTVSANDKNKYVIELAKKAIKGDFNDNTFTPKFIKREHFFNVLHNPEKYEEWFVGYIMCIWSFGNNQKGYLFGKDIEFTKEAGYELVINKNPDLILKLFPQIPKNYIQGILKQDNWHKRRIALNQVAKKLGTRIFELQQLERLQGLEGLERLERLQQLQQLQGLGKLQLYSEDYRNIKIEKNDIIYCDPPYKGTATYKEGGFNHDEFFEWCREKSKTNKIYISEYNAPKDFIKILEFEQKSTLSGGTNKKQPNECLFTI